MIDKIYYFNSILISSQASKFVVIKKYKKLKYYKS